jgi:Flp pilus assembly protein TadD
MPQIYVVLIGVTIITGILTRRTILWNRERRDKFKEEVASRVDEFQKERAQLHKERFREVLNRERSKKRYDLSQYKLIIRKADMAIARECWNEAKKHLIQSMAHTDDEFSVSVKLASVYLNTGDSKRAESIYRRLLEIEPENTTILENLAKIHVKRKEYREAIQLYVSALEIDPRDDKKLAALGKLYSLLMRPSLAGECFRRAAELKPREVEYLMLLGDACKKDNDFENALYAYERILTMEPYNEKAREEAQDVRLRMNEIEKALNTL